jgi:hypothetical protein
MAPVRIVHGLADGLLPGVRVIGFHGDVGPDQTPARRGPVYADEAGRLLRLIDVKPAPSGYEVRMEADEPPIGEGPLPGIGTRLAGWPARLDSFVAIVGERERGAAERLKGSHRRGEPPRVQRFVEWIAGSERSSEELTCERLKDIVAWYCAPEEAYALWQRIQEIAEEELYHAVASGSFAAIKGASFWLSRAKVTDRDIYLAAAALKRAASPHWETLLRQGARDRTPDERRAGVNEAEKFLERRAALTSSENKQAAAAPGLTSRNNLRKRFMVKAAA